MPRARPPADHPARRVAYPGSAGPLVLPLLHAQRRGIADSETKRREAEARKDAALNSVDNFRTTATTPRPGNTARDAIDVIDGRAQRSRRWRCTRP
jgi:hypothetical protein